MNRASGPWLPLADEAATLAFGAKLARALPEDAAPLVLYLHGDLGAGKTTLARGMLRQLGEIGPVRSPTFALLAQYFPGGQAVVHLDLYRLDAPAQLQALGLADYLTGSRLWLIEWPGNAQGAGLPAPDAHVVLEPEGSARRIRIDPVSQAGERLAGQVAADSG